MNISRHPELLDRLAAAYALGTLRGAARRRFEQLARDQAPVRAAALLWQGRWSAFSEVQAPVAPDAAVYGGIRPKGLIVASMAASGALAGLDQPVPLAVAVWVAHWLSSLRPWRIRSDTAGSASTTRSCRTSSASITRSTAGAGRRPKAWGWGFSSPRPCWNGRARG